LPWRRVDEAKAASQSLRAKSSSRILERALLLMPLTLLPEAAMSGKRIRRKLLSTVIVGFWICVDVTCRPITSIFQVLDTADLNIHIFSITFDRP
jgi:hypothetical protein